jgi:hypothetical protein
MRLGERRGSMSADGVGCDNMGRTMTRSGQVFAGLVAVAAVLAAPGARADLDSAKCLAQMRDASRDAVDCKVSAALDKEHSERLKKATQGVITAARCTVPLSFRKAPVYAEVIKGKDVALPTLKVTCVITGNASDEPATASAELHPQCARNGKEWACVANVKKIEGMGMLGGLLEKLANDSDTVKRAMAKFMAELDRAAHVNVAKAPDGKADTPKK